MFLSMNIFSLFIIQFGSTGQGAHQKFKQEKPEMDDFEEEK